ncbi:hypothetical protein TorRG33x02_189250 [Trema orientale]|uniref:Uncharacterized protein n=1 Tax=Trema orientale TaxID=63057 RepID=A0A2P5EI89_TREOI|nr:hypothetical protein TorRG33x02_189250 [Trema orientale]
MRYFGLVQLFKDQSSARGSRQFYTFHSMKDANVSNHITPGISFSKDCSQLLGVSGHDSWHVGRINC